ncbi:MAG: hydantoinase/oxoprolinase family protein [Planctomycetota bacterium]|nr:hydantoinase/oxoprolinase family protein [Planctomycetota bacterium]
MTDRYGVDTGGTYTDLVGWVGGRLIRKKVPSTPKDPGQAVVSALGSAKDREGELIHGSTVATNALLERRGVPCGLVVTAGFEDVIEIGRQDRPNLYDLKVRRSPPLVPRAARFGVRERVTAQGEILLPVSEDDLAKVGQKLREQGVRSVAVCFLHSYRNPENERKAAAFLRSSGDFFVVASSDVLPEYREVERFTTATVSASITPIMADYVDSLEKQISPRLWIMHSGGGIVPAGSVRSEAARTVLSGPAAGVVGGLRAARAAGYERAITFDMGGTSTDVALCDGDLPMTNQVRVGDLRVTLPSIDIVTVGAGGGSIAWVDAGGALRVGPRSAGADPGPVAFGKGEEITVTDASLFLGRVQKGAFLSGMLRLDYERVEASMARLGKRVNLNVHETAEGVLEVARAEVGRALRRVSLERGHDPAEFALVAFGGAGPLHALEVARDLGCSIVIIPPDPGLVSAMGLLCSDHVAHASQTVVGSGREPDDVFADMAERTAADLGGSKPEDVLERYSDLRYRGQSYEITVPWGSDRAERFHEAHSRAFGTSDRSRDVQEVALRLTRRRLVSPPDMATPWVEPRELEPSGLQIEGRWRQVTVYEREAMAVGKFLNGPALITEYSSTTYLPPGTVGAVHESGSIVLRWKGGGE